MTVTANFPLPLRGEWLTPRKFKLLETFKYVDPDLDIEVTVPAGFVTDFNSVPRLFWAYFAPLDCPEAGLVHDWLYDHPSAYRRMFTPSPPTSPLSKAECDNIHRRILHLKGFRWSKRQLLWGILRTAGIHAWRKHRAQDVVVEPQDDHKTPPKFDLP